jgi:hypothetical protein
MRDLLANIDGGAFSMCICRAAVLSGKDDSAVTKRVNRAKDGVVERVNADHCVFSALGRPAV